MDRNSWPRSEESYSSLELCVSAVYQQKFLWCWWRHKLMTAAHGCSWRGWGGCVCRRARDDGWRSTVNWWWRVVKWSARRDPLNTVYSSTPDSNPPQVLIPTHHRYWYEPIAGTDTNPPQVLILTHHRYWYKPTTGTDTNSPQVLIPTHHRYWYCFARTRTGSNFVYL